MNVGDEKWSKRWQGVVEDGVVEGGVDRGGGQE